MKYQQVILSFFTLIIVLSLSAQELSRESYNRYVGTSMYVFKSEGHGQLVMKNILGDVYIVGEPIDKVEIVETITIKSNSKERAEEIFEKSKAEVVQTSVEGEELSLRVTGQRFRKRGVSYDYSVHVPPIFSLMVETGGGDIETENVKGQIELYTSGGDIELTDLSGRISGSTSGGDIEVKDMSGRVFLNTSGGDIDAERIEGELSSKTSGGDITVDEVKGSVSVNTSGGDIDLSDIDGREIYAKTSGGDITAESILGKVDLNTSGGGIDMDYIRGEVEASTSGGDINMDEIWGAAQVWTAAGSIEGTEIFGAIDARTSVGDIVISKKWDKDLEDHDINLKTGGGDIELTLPDKFPVDFSIRVLTPGGKSSDAIESDFELYITASHGFSRAKGQVGEGIYKVELESSMGTITISKED